jgi:hypothetical protein
MDWIGLTKTLSSETLPLLTKMIFGLPNMGKRVPTKNSSSNLKKRTVSLSEIQNSTRETLEHVSSYDQELYDKVLQDFKMDQWSNDPLGNTQVS